MSETTNEDLKLQVGETKLEVEKLKLQFQTLILSFTSLQTEFKYFRNIMITLYLTIIAPLMVAVIMGMLTKR